MTPLNQMSVDELNRTLAISKWLLGVFAVLTAFAGIFNQWITDRIATLQTQAKTEARRRLEITEAELQETKAKTIKLEAQLAPRTIPEAQWSSVVTELTQYAGTQFEFVSYQEDAEVRNLVMPIIKVLLKAGWKGLPARDFLLGNLVEGVVIEYAPASSDFLGPPAQALCKNLNANSVVASTAMSNEMTAFGDRLRITVGKKPSHKP